MRLYDVPNPEHTPARNCLIRLIEHTSCTEMCNWCVPAEIAITLITKCLIT